MREIVMINASKSAQKKKPISSDKSAVKTTLKNDFFPGLTSPSQSFGNSNPMSLPYQLGQSNSYFLLSIYRIYLTYAYSTHGIAQTIIDQPVEDGFRGGFKIETDELGPEEIDEIQRDLVEEGHLKNLKEAIKWKRLFGGAALIINDGRELSTPFDENAVDENTPLSFIPADRWEILLSLVDAESGSDCPYNYYGESVHKSRVIKMVGKEAPSFIRRQLQGWGMSVLECLLRNLNAYTRNEEVVYELIQEAKIDVWKINGFNSNILNAQAEGQISQRLEIATQAKNYHSAVIMDTEDEYDQKQISMSGLGDILEQIRIGMAAAARIPMAKLFGLSAAGFNSGEDDIENYISIVESTVREDARNDIHRMVRILCMRRFGIAPEIVISFKPLRILSAEQEENVKNARFTRARQTMMDGYFTPKEYWQQLKADGVFSVDTEVFRGEREPEPPMMALDMASPDGGERGPGAGSKKKDGDNGK